MAIRKVKLVEGEIYHIYNSGVDKRDIFIDDEDRIRFIHDLYEFNDKNPAPNLNDYLVRSKIKNLEVGLPDMKRKPREVLVEILAYCLMDNHFHLLVRQVTTNGVTEFMRKMGTGYTNYFNQKYERNGALFQGKFKSVHIEKDAHLMYMPIYIHFNPLDLSFPEWRKGKIKEHKKALEFLDSYRWSSYMDYTGQKNFPSLIKKDFILKRLGSEEKFKKEAIGWLKNFDESNIKDVSLE
ncbi:transposase [Candidatus Nomurabacteria bacterium]|nr:transposase [Candidatus Nomurabacteria bacterium]